MINKLLTKRNAYLFVLIVSAIGMGTSLYYSEILGLEPCLLCWYQRIALYPLVPLSIVALVRKSKDFALYGLPLSLIGLGIALYHYTIQQIGKTAEITTPCSVGGPSCTGIYLEYFGFVTIPFMSLIAFLLISVVLFLSLRLDRMA